MSVFAEASLFLLHSRAGTLSERWKPPGQGTGLGLSTVHGIVQRANGHIEVLSELGEGTIFRIHLPQASSTELAIPAIALSKTLPPGHRRTVLVCEDEAVIRGVISEVLVRHGFTVHATGSPREALALGLKLGGQCPCHWRGVKSQFPIPYELGMESSRIERTNRKGRRAPSAAITVRRWQLLCE